MLTRGLYAVLLLDAGFLVLAVALGGRPVANAHPWVRGGGGPWAEWEMRDTGGERKP